MLSNVNVEIMTTHCPALLVITNHLYKIASDLKKKMSRKVLVIELLEDGNDGCKARTNKGTVERKSGKVNVPHYSTVIIARFTYDRI